MNFELKEEQRLLSTTVASFVRRESPVTRLRALRSDPIGWSRDVWRKMGDFGWLGVLFPEELGGSGGSFVDAALILEQLGTTLVPEPFIPALITGYPLFLFGEKEQHKAFLTPMIEGRTSLALAYAEAEGRFGESHVSTRAERTARGYRIDGSKRWVLNGHAADTLVVSARTAGGAHDEEGISLFIVDGDAPGLVRTPVKTMDGHHAAMLALHGVHVSEDRRLGPEGSGYAALSLSLDVGAAAACAEGLGIIKTVLAMTTDYLRTREQFGVKIGSFQALQHRAVDMFVESELSRSMSILASIKVLEPDEIERQSAISAAKVQLSMAGRYVTQQAIQLHGGIGVTDEHDVGLYFKRMHILCTLFGDEEHHVARFARLPNFEAGLDAAP